MIRKCVHYTSKREWKRIYKKTWYAAAKWRRRFPREQTRKKQKIITRKYVSTDSVASFTDVARSKEWLRHEKKKKNLTFSLRRETHKFTGERKTIQPTQNKMIYFFVFYDGNRQHQNGWWPFISRNCVVLYHEIKDFWCGIFIYYTIFKSVNIYNIYIRARDKRENKKTKHILTIITIIIYLTR